MLIAVTLSKNQRFEEAQRWFHYIFDPTEHRPAIDAAAAVLAVPAVPRGDRRRSSSSEHRSTELSTAGDSELAPHGEEQIAAWRDNPFQPHVVARLRYLAYQKTW